MLRALLTSRSCVAPKFTTRNSRPVLPQKIASSSRPRSVTTMACEIYQFGALSDNYGYLVHDKATGSTAAIDTPEA